MSQTDSPPLISMSAQGLLPTLIKDEQGKFSLQLDLPGLQIALRLEAAQVRALGLMCLHHFPAIEPRFAVPEQEDAYRLPARKISLLDDRSVQILLRELQSDDLIVFLWYMKDAELAKQMLRNMSQRAAQMLFDDLQSRHRNMHPDRAPLAYVEAARTSTLAILAVVDRLQDEGQIPNI